MLPEEILITDDSESDCIEALEFRAPRTKGESFPGIYNLYERARDRVPDQIKSQKRRLDDSGNLPVNNWFATHSHVKRGRGVSRALRLKTTCIS